MKKKVNCIMLIDDNPDDNFVHKRVILKHDFADKVVEMESGAEALQFLKEKSDHPEDHPHLIFLDINMPGMNGWEFLEEYRKLDETLQSKFIVVMLTTSQNEKDREKALSMDILADFKTKPLTKAMMEEIMITYS